MPPSFRPGLTSLEDRTVPAVTLADVGAAFAQTDALDAQVQGFLSKRIEFHNVYTLDYWRVYAGQVSLLSVQADRVLSEYQNALTAAAVNDPTLATEISRVEKERYKAEVDAQRGLGIGQALGGNIYPFVAVPIPPGQPIPANPPPVPPAPPPVDTTTNSGTTGVIPNLTDPAFTDLGTAGLRIKDVVVGQGAPATAGQDVKVFYTGFLASNGTVFDGNRDKSPTTFNLNGVIQGFNQGIQGMQPGGVRDIFIPAALGYGAAGSGSSIPPNADLVFEVKLLSSSAPATSAASGGTTTGTGNTTGTGGSAGTVSQTPTGATTGIGTTLGNGSATTGTGTGTNAPVTPEVGATNGTSGVGGPTVGTGTTGSSGATGSSSGTTSNNTGSAGTGAGGPPVTGT
jgi:FKBP-type peptidyl-prolyl cis-trans isomerase FkpA